MKKKVRIYIEGGSTGKTADNDFRRGWKKFLSELHVLARQNGFQTLEVVRGKGRGNTFERFKSHTIANPNDLCVLLVDAETSVAVNANVWDVVANREGDNWQCPTWATEDHLYLMVAFVETWLLTDQQAIAKYFRRDVNLKKLPTTNLESRSKASIETALKQATKNCKKGPYRHGQAHEIIELVNPESVKKLSHGARLFDNLGHFIRQHSET